MTQLNTANQASTQIVLAWAEYFIPYLRKGGVGGRGITDASDAINNDISVHEVR